MGTGLTSALVAALVAAVVTLVIEYLAKPTLEARKERILRRYLDAGERTQALVDIVKWLSVIQTTSGPAQYKVLPIATEHLRAAAEKLLSTPLDLTLRTNSEAIRLTTRFASFTLGHLTGDLRVEQLTVAAAVASPLADYYYAPRWRVMYRRRRLREALDHQSPITDRRWVVE